MSARDARRAALALPEALEQDHHGFPSFRVGGKIFATLPDAQHMSVMLDSNEVDAALDTDPGACAELWWGKALAGVRVTLAAAPADLLAGLLRAAWRRRAPKRLRDRCDAR